MEYINTERRVEDVNRELTLFTREGEADGEGPMGVAAGEMVEHVKRASSLG